MSEENNNIPQTGSAQWKKNEKIINENPTLKRARDQAQGFNPNSRSYGASHGGKGSARRGGNDQLYADNWDKIFGNSSKHSDQDTESNGSSD